jgi:hypothetical protein
MNISKPPREMAHAVFHIHGELNDFLPHARRDRPFVHPFDWRGSIKDRVESLGVPHCEIEALVVNGEPVGFHYLVQPDDVIDVLPHDPLAERDRLLRDPLPDGRRFVLDTHLGRLACYLRMMGFDTLYRNDYADDELARISCEEERILLTRDIGLLKRSIVTYGRFVRATNPRLQLVEISRRYDLPGGVLPFRRCLKCNGTLHAVEKAAIRHRLTDDTARHYDEFHLCRNCGQIYWKGSHYDRMQAFIAEVLAER